MQVFPIPAASATTDVSFSYIRKPVDPAWSFTVGNVGQYVYDSSASTNFEISDSQQTEVILEILKYSGIIIRDQQVVIAAAQQLAQEEDNSKR